MKVWKTVAMLGGSFAIYVVTSCASQAIRDQDKPQGWTKDARVDLDTDLADVVDAVRDALSEAGPADAKADPPATSGTRLRARYNVTKSADGAVWRQFAGWYDSTRKENCSQSGFAAKDGVTRCLPPATMTAATFADAACTIPVVLVGTASTCGTSSPTYAMTYSFDSTCGRYIIERFFRVGPDAALTKYYDRNATTGACATTPTAVPSGSKALSVAEVPLSEFVTLAITEEID